MNDWLALVVAVAVLVTVFWAVPVYRRRRAARQPQQRFEQAVRQNVVVHTSRGYSIDGVLSGLYADGVTLTSASFLRSNGEPPEPLDGEQIVPWRSIEWIQEYVLARSADA